MAEHALMSASTKKDSAIYNNEPGSGDTKMQAVEDEGDKDALLQSLIHMIEGDYNKISDVQLGHIVDQFNSYAEFIEKHRPAISKPQASGFNQ